MMFLHKLKQLLCKHKYTRLSWVFIETLREDSGRRVMGMPVWGNYNHFSEVYMCDKCGKLEKRMTSYLAKDHNCSVLR